MLGSVMPMIREVRNQISVVRLANAIRGRRSWRREIGRVGVMIGVMSIVMEEDFYWGLWDLWYTL